VRTGGRCAPTARLEVSASVNKKELNHFQKRLHEELANLSRTIGKLEKSVLSRSQRESSGDLSGYSLHMADMGTDASEREKDLLLASAEGRIVIQIREALQKIAKGSYGDCDDCGKPIGAKRLELIPYAAFCTRCQMKAERSVS
jgi:RNA polymerase-binding protein DksA